MNKFYGRKWGFEPGNATSGFEVGRRDTNGMLNWPACDQWNWIGNLISFNIRVWDLEVMFRFYHPNEWRGWALQVHPTRG